MFPKIRKSRKSPIGLVSEIKLIRTDLSLFLTYTMKVNNVKKVSTIKKGTY